MDRGRRENRAEGVNDIFFERRDRTDLVFEAMLVHLQHPHTLLRRVGSPKFVDRDRFAGGMSDSRTGNVG